jgi:hypothetical protein
MNIRERAFPTSSMPKLFPLPDWIGRRDFHREALREVHGYLT